MFLPVRIALGAGGRQSAAYDRSIELTDRQLGAFAAHAGDMTEPLSLIGADLHTNIAAQFASEGATGATGKWTVLSEPYRSWKAEHGGPPMLVGLRPAHKGSRTHPARGQSYTISGRMRSELLDPLATHVTARRLLYAPTSDIAGFHETGTSKMPARPPVALTPSFLHSIDRTFVRWIAKLMSKTGL